MFEQGTKSRKTPYYLPKYKRIALNLAVVVAVIGGMAILVPAIAFAALMLRAYFWHAEHSTSEVPDILTSADKRRRQKLLDKHLKKRKEKELKEFYKMNNK